MSAFRVLGNDDVPAERREQARSSFVGGLLAAGAETVRENARTLELLDLGRADRVLEIGFGPGRALGDVAWKVPDGFIAGVDHSECMVERAESRYSVLRAAGRLRLPLPPVPSRGRARVRPPA